MPKMTFGIQPKHIEVIDAFFKVNPDLKYNYHIWKRFGQDFKWDAFTLALAYFEHKEKDAADKGLDELKGMGLGKPFQLPDNKL